MYLFHSLPVDPHIGMAYPGGGAEMDRPRLFKKKFHIIHEPEYSGCGLDVDEVVPVRRYPGVRHRFYNSQQFPFSFLRGTLVGQRINLGKTERTL